MSKRGENIYKRKDGRWEARYQKERDGQGRIKYGYIYAKTYSEAKEHLVFAKAFNSAAEKTSRTIYGDILDLWLERIGVRVKQSTWARYKHIVNRYLRAEFGNRCIELINTSDVELFAGQGTVRNH